MKGHAGVGKTWLTQQIVKENSRNRWVLTAPTNKASRVLRQMAKATGLSPDVSTAYSALGLRLQANGEVRRVEAVGKVKVKDYDVMVVDEGSMVNSVLRRELLKAIDGTPIKVLYVMDPLQLPPVGEDDSAVAGITDSVTLTEIVRQAKGNPIIQTTELLRQAILDRRMPKFTARKSEQGGIYLQPEAQWMHWMKAGFNSTKYLDDPNAFRTLAYRNARVGSINFKLRRVLYPDHYRERFVAGHVHRRGGHRGEGAGAASPDLR
jgi:exodeoxyribonuclease-5